MGQFCGFPYTANDGFRKTDPYIHPINNTKNAGSWFCRTIAMYRWIMNSTFTDYHCKTPLIEAPFFLYRYLPRVALKCPSRLLLVGYDRKVYSLNGIYIPQDNSVNIQ